MHLKTLGSSSHDKIIHICSLLIIGCSHTCTVIVTLHHTLTIKGPHLQKCGQGIARLLSQGRGEAFPDAKDTAAVSGHMCNQ